METETKQRKQRAPIEIIVFLTNAEGVNHTLIAKTKKELDGLLSKLEGYRITSIYKAHEVKFTHKVVSTLEF